jgi:hypothetical protein
MSLDDYPYVNSDVLSNILINSDYDTIKIFNKTNKNAKKITMNTNFWKHKVEHELEYINDEYEYFLIACSRNQREIIDIFIKFNLINIFSKMVLTDIINASNTSLLIHILEIIDNNKLSTIDDTDTGYYPIIKGDTPEVKTINLIFHLTNLKFERQDLYYGNQYSYLYKHVSNESGYPMRERNALIIYIKKSFEFTQSILFYPEYFTEETGLKILNNLPDEIFNIEILEYFYKDDILSLEIIKKYSKLEYNRMNMLNALLFDLEEEENILIDAPYGKYVSIIIGNMSDAEIKKILFDAIIQPYDYVDFILEFGNATNDTINNAIISGFNEPDVIDIGYGGDISSIVASLDKHTNLSDLKLITLAVENNIPLLVNEILNYITIDDEKLSFRIQQII